jgi:hypothetical protein
MTTEELREALVWLDEGVLLKGARKAADRRAEFQRTELARFGLVHSDRPGDLPDLQPLNDGPWSSDQARTEALLPVLSALWDWQAWPVDLAFLTVSRADDSFYAFELVGVE